jgi:predicted permease
VSSLLLVRAASRRREIALRAALGAGFARVARQLLTETLLLVTAGGAAGAVLAVWLVDAMRVALPRLVFVPRLDEVALDAPGLAFALVLTAVVASLCGVAPALHAARVQVAEALKGGRAPHSAVGPQRLLVAAETAIAVVVLASSGLVVRSFVNLARVDPGFTTHGVLTTDVAPSPARYRDGQAQVAFFDRLLEELGARGGVRAVALGHPLPFSGASSQSRALPEGVPFTKENSRLTDFVTVSPRYFEVMGIPVRSGRDFDETDREGAPRVVIVGEAAARAFWPGQDPVGKRLCFELEFPADGPPIPTWREVIGVVGHVKHYTLAQDSRQQIYVPYRQMPLYNRGLLPSMTLVLRGDGGAAATAPLREAMRTIDSNQPLLEVRTLESALEGSTGRARLLAWLISAFAAAGLLLCAVGTFGLVSQLASQRAREISVRQALGAGRAEVRRLFLGEGLKPVAAGAVVGLAATVALTRGIRGLLFGLSPTDPSTLAAATLLLVAVACGASWIPARRAATQDPASVLRAE